MNPIQSGLGLIGEWASKTFNNAKEWVSDKLDISSILKSIKTKEPHKVNNEIKPNSSFLNKLPGSEKIQSFISNARKEIDAKDKYNKALTYVSNRFALKSEKFNKLARESTKDANSDIYKTAEKFVNENPSDVGGIDKLRVLESIKKSYAPNRKVNEILPSLENGEIVSLQFDWVPKGHSIGLNLFKNESGQYFLIKSGNTRPYNVQVFQILKTSNIESAITKLIEYKQSAAADYHYKEMQKELGLLPKSSITLSWKQGDAEGRTVGELLVAGTACASEMQHGNDPISALNEASKFHKDFVQFDKKEAVNKLKEFLKIEYRASGSTPTPDDLLITLLSQASKSEDFELLNELIDHITPEIFSKALQHTSNTNFIALSKKFNALLTPEVFLKAIEGRSAFELKKNEFLAPQTISHFLELISGNPQLKNSPEVQRKILEWAEQKIISNNILRKSNSEIEDLKREIYKFSDTPLFSELINKIPFGSSDIAKSVVKIPQDLPVLEDLLKDPSRKEKLINGFMETVNAMPAKELDENFNGIIQFMNRNASSFSPDAFNAIGRLGSEKFKNYDVFIQKLIQNGSPVNPEVLNGVIFTALKNYNFELIEKLDEALVSSAKPFKEYLKNLKESDLDSISRIFAGRILAGQKDFNLKEFTLLEKIGINFNKEIHFDGSPWANLKPTSLNLIRNEFDLT